MSAMDLLLIRLLVCGEEVRIVCYDRGYVCNLLNFCRTVGIWGKNRVELLMLGVRDGSRSGRERHDEIRQRGREPQ